MNSLIVEHQQFDMIVRLMNAALQDDSDMDEYGIAATLLPLSTVFGRRLTKGVIQFVYTLIQVRLQGWLLELLIFYPQLMVKPSKQNLIIWKISDILIFQKYWDTLSPEDIFLNFSYWKLSLLLFFFLQNVDSTVRNFRSLGTSSFSNESATENLDIGSIFNFLLQF